MSRAVLLLASLLVAGCGQWDAFVYDDADDLSQSETLTGFDSFEECQAAAINRLRQKDLAEVGTYECGRKCRWDPAYEVNVCQETRE